MATLTSILSTALLSDSRQVINDNDQSLNANKVETSTLTGSYSTTSTLLGQYMTPSTVSGTFTTYNQASPSVLSMQPMIGNGFVGLGTVSLSGNTNGYAALFNFPQAIQFNALTFNITSVLVGGQLGVGWYSENGQGLISSVTTTAYATLGQKTTNVSSVRLEAGNYYTVVVPISSVNVLISGMTYGGVPGAFPSIIGNTKLGYSGILNVTAGTLPTSFNPSSVLLGNTSVLAYRLDQ